MSKLVFSIVSYNISIIVFLSNIKSSSLVIKFFILTLLNSKFLPIDIPELKGNVYQITLSFS